MNPAIRALFGAPIGLDTAGGFTVWRVGTVTAVLLGARAILATTRITRGEEDAGRWDLLLSGRLPAPAVLLRHLASVMAVAAATATAVTAALVLSGTEPAGAMVHGAHARPTARAGLGEGKSWLRPRRGSRTTRPARVSAASAAIREAPTTTLPLRESPTVPAQAKVRPAT
ncbi:hypothetical protein M1L60_39875 [Actinoplanes sp. TRM 88003]|uniref:Uncharacterized protein n=1 Tax=Paractinoplanes aksuensis TaxID=2939490 RepID=A0ABT1E0Z6_9ACTN|nr:hypothetical protein [Actinoplanes aksuensis]MCO8276758.1 hypothetical protein [Actinoplanes aksuensis]